jgi:hypothetical protein
VLGLWYLRYRCILKRPFFWYQDCDLVTLILNFDLVLKIFDLGYIFWTKCVRAFYMRYRCIMKRPFLWYQNFWLCDLDLWPIFEKTLTWAISFEPNVSGLWYLRYRCTMKRLSFGTKTCDLDLEFWPSFEKLLPGLYILNFWTKCVRAIDALWRNTKTFDLVVLILNFDLVLKN